MTDTITTPPQCSKYPPQHTDEWPTRELQAAPPIDCDRLRERCLGNMDFALALLDEFKTTGPARLAAFDAALAEHNHAAIASEAHGFKGVAGVLTGNTLMQMCSNLEAATKDADWNQTRELVQQVHHEVRRMIDFIPNIRAGVK